MVRVVQPGSPGGTAPLTWWPQSGSVAREPVTWMRCPFGHVGTLEDHTIHPDGTVEPSVACPVDGCAFHEDVKLAAWPEGTQEVS